MKTYTLQWVIVTLLFLSPFTMAADPAFKDDPLPPHSAAYRRPADRWLENMRKENPDEYRRLQRLRETDPDAFVSELRARIRAHSIERLLNQNPLKWDGLQNTPCRQFGLREGKNDNPRGTGGSSKSMTRAEQEAAYDQRTKTIEHEVERISRQLENLRRMLEERKKKRDRVITRSQTSDR